MNIKQQIKMAADEYLTNQCYKKNIDMYFCDECKQRFKEKMNFKYDFNSIYKDWYNEVYKNWHEYSSCNMMYDMYQEFFKRLPEPYCICNKCLNNI